MTIDLSVNSMLFMIGAVGILFVVAAIYLNESDCSAYLFLLGMAMIVGSSGIGAYRYYFSNDTESPSATTTATYYDTVLPNGWLKVTQNIAKLGHLETRIVVVEQFVKTSPTPLTVRGFDILCGYFDTNPEMLCPTKTLTTL